MQKFSAYTLAIALCPLFSGCAAIVSGTEQTISVETPGCPGARCKLVNDKGVWYVQETPGSVTVHRAYNALTVTCTKEGMSSDTVGAAESSTKGMAFGNILLGGIIGAGVDVGTGAAYDYPQVISIPMECKEKPAVAVAEDKPVSGNNPDPDTLDDQPATADECLELSRKIEAAGTDDFIRAVLQENYKNKCGKQ